MAANIYFDLSEEIEQDLCQIYQSLCDELTNSLTLLEHDLEDFCNQTQFEPIVSLINKTINLFNDEIFQLSNRAFEEWKDSSGSFVYVSRNSQAGDLAIETAQQIEQNLKDIFDSFWISKPLGEGLQIDTSRPKVKDEDFDALKEIYIKFFQNVENLGQETINNLSTKSDDNSTYNLIIPAVRVIIEPIKNAFEQFSVKIDEAKADSESLSSQQEKNNEEASEMIVKTSATAADVAEALKMYGDI